MATGVGVPHAAGYRQGPGVLALAGHRARRPEAGQRAAQVHRHRPPRLHLQVRIEPPEFPEPHACSICPHSSSRSSQQDQASGEGSPAAQVHSLWQELCSLRCSAGLHTSTHCAYAGAASAEEIPAALCQLGPTPSYAVHKPGSTPVDDAPDSPRRLADFGLSRMLEFNATHVSTQTFGTVPYMPHELLSDGRMGKSADVSAAGSVCIALLSRLPCFALRAPASGASLCRSVIFRAAHVPSSVCLRLRASRLCCGRRNKHDCHSHDLCVRSITSVPAGVQLCRRHVVAADIAAAAPGHDHHAGVAAAGTLTFVQLLFWSMPFSALRCFPYVFLVPKHEPQTLAAQVMYNVVNKGMRPPLPEELPPRYRSLIEACWSERPEDRCADVLALRPEFHTVEAHACSKLGSPRWEQPSPRQPALLPWPRWLPHLHRSGTSSV